MVKSTEILRTVKTVRRKTVEQGGKTETTERVRVRKETTRTVWKGGRKPQGVVLYRGPSLLDDTPIVSVATDLARRSKNPKTGDMVQVFVLGDNGEDPLQANRSGRDKAVCGNCPHRLGSCYVNLAFAPLSVYRAVQAGTYPIYRPNHLDLFRGRHIRLGAYGDPAAVPLPVWEVITSVAAGWTGYTHQWEHCDPGYARYCMASVDTPGQRQAALAKGYRTFRVRLPGEPLEPGEFVCPASAEAGHRLTCQQCLACSGAKEGGANASPAIHFHGSTIANGWAERMFRQALAHRAEEAQRFALPTVN